MYIVEIGLRLNTDSHFSRIDCPLSCLTVCDKRSAKSVVAIIVIVIVTAVFWFVGMVASNLMPLGIQRATQH